MTPRRLCATIVLGLAAGVGFQGLAMGGTVKGAVLLPAKLEEPAVRNTGYVSRIKNAIVEVRPYDPFPLCFVFLEGDSAPPEASSPPARNVTLELGTASFRRPLQPVVVGTTVEIKNVGKGTHPIYSADAAELGEAPPIGPGGVRSVTVKPGMQVIHLRSKDSPHVDGRIVALPTRYFAPVTRYGRFVIPDVAPGKWTLKVWYRDGWLPVKQVVEVGKGTSDVNITLPERLQPQAPAAAAPADAPAAP